MLNDPELNDPGLAGLDLKARPRFVWPTIHRPALTLALTMLYLGLILGVSFLATPVKFSAPSLSLPVALDVGRVTFSLFHMVEWGMVALLVLITFSAPAPFHRSTLQSCLVLGLAAILLVDGLWLLPHLSERVQAIIDGAPPAPSPHHALYAGLELIKTGLLLGLAQRQLAALSRKPAGNPPCD